MDDEITHLDGYVIHGLGPAQADVLLDALDQAGIDALIELNEEPLTVHDEGDNGGQKIRIFVDNGKETEAREITASLFGEAGL